MKKKIVVIGGGAAGLMAAITAAENGAQVTVLERMEKCGRKIRITGKGRCNLTNVGDEFSSKIASGTEFMQHSLDVLTPQMTLKKFEEMGVDLTVERGNRVFPTSGKAWDVADAMVAQARRAGVTIVYNCRVQKVIVNNNVVSAVSTDNNKNYPADRVIIATGGKSYPRTGSSGDGYYITHDLGHNIEPLRPSLVSLGINSKELKQLTGLKLKNVELSLLIDDKKSDSRFGELEFFNYGIGGALTLQVSRLAVDAMIDGKRVDVEIDLKSALSHEKLLARCKREQEGGARDYGSLLRKLLPKALCSDVASQAGIKTKALCDSKGVDRIVNTLKALKYKVTDYGSYDEAVVTAGGVSLDEVDPQTMHSHKVKGLYIAGELLDIDAQTGGYNLQLAFSSGYVAGKSAAND